MPIVLHSFSQLSGKTKGAPAVGHLRAFDSLPELAEWVKSKVVEYSSPEDLRTQKHKVPGFVLANLKDGVKLDSAVTGFSNLIGLDFDNLDENATLSLLEALEPYEYLIYTTGSHLTIKANCFRVLLTLDRPPEVGQYLDAWVSCFLDFKGLDKQCKDPSRGFVLPVEFPGRSPDIEYHPGRPYSWEAGLSQYEQPITAPTRPEELRCGAQDLRDFAAELAPLFEQADGNRNAFRLGFVGILQTTGCSRELGQELFNQAFASSKDSRAKFAAIWHSTEKKEKVLCWGPEAFLGDKLQPKEAQSIRQLFTPGEYQAWRLRLNPPMPGSSDVSDPLLNPTGEILAELDTNKEGDPKSNLPNAVKILVPLVAHDEFKNRMVWLQDIPVIKAEAQSVVTDQHVAALALHWIQSEWRWGLKRTDVHEALTLASGAHQYDALRDYVLTLPPHDLQPRAERLLQGIGATPSGYLQEVTRIFLCGLVHRALNPGADFDFALVLKGGEGWGKSKLFRFLVPRRDWATALKGKLDSADTMTKWSSHWVAEWAETKSQSMDALKELLTEAEDTYRNPYGHFANFRPRRVCFYATTNRDQWHDDSHGGRRFLVVDVPGAKANPSDQLRIREHLEWVEANRDQIWAEALAWYRSNAEWWRLSDEGHQRATETIQRDSVKNFWEEYVQELVPGLSQTDATSLMDLARMIDPDKKLSPYESRKLTQTLVSLGFRPTSNNPKHRKWLPPLNVVEFVQTKADRETA